MVVLVIAAVYAAALYSLTRGIRLSSGIAPTTLGWMSDRWLAEYRGSHAS
jgi:hypothetical protein